MNRIKRLSEEEKGKRNKLLESWKENQDKSPKGRAAFCAANGTTSVDLSLALKWEHGIDVRAKASDAFSGMGGVPGLVELRRSAGVTGKTVRIVVGKAGIELPEGMGEDGMMRVFRCLEAVHAF